MGGGYGVCMETSDEVLGVIPRVVRELFAKIDTLDDQDVTVKVSYLEVLYMFPIIKSSTFLKTFYYLRYLRVCLNDVNLG